jgi:hypothetical protein
MSNALMFACYVNSFSNGTGAFSTFGLTTNEIITDGNTTTLLCSSSHLSVFAALVNVAGNDVCTSGQMNFEPIRAALEIELL